MGCFNPAPTECGRNGTISEPTNTFAALLTCARQGDAQALHELTRLYEPELRLVARVRLGPALRPYLDSVDLVQSVHKSLLLGLRHGKFDISSPNELLALALTMVRRKVARHWRHLQRQQRLEGKAGDTTELAQLLLSLSSPGADPAQAVQFTDLVQHVCHHLQPVERRILELHLHGYSSPEIARELGEADNVVRVRLSRLRQRLQAQGVLAE